MSIPDDSQHDADHASVQRPHSDDGSSQIAAHGGSGDSIDSDRGAGSPDGHRPGTPQTDEASQKGASTHASTGAAAGSRIAAASDLGVHEAPGRTAPPGGDPQSADR